MKQKKSGTAKKHLSSILYFFLLTAICVVSSVAIVWPLWKFSTSLPKVYTIAVLVLVAAFIIYFAVRTILKSRPLSVIKFFVNLLVIAATLFFSVKCIINENIAAGLIILGAGTACEIAGNIIFSKFAHE